MQTTISLPDAVRQITAGSFEGNPKWLTINRNQDVLNYAAQQASVNNQDLFNTECSVMPVIAYLADHKAETLDRVVNAAAGFVRQARRKRSPVPARGRQRGHRGCDQYRRRAGEPHDAALRLRSGHDPVLHHLPKLARGGGGRRAARADVDPLRGADGRPRHRGQGRDAPGHRARRGHWRRLRAVPACRSNSRSSAPAHRWPRPTAGLCSSRARSLRWSGSRWLLA